MKASHTQYAPVSDLEATVVDASTPLKPGATGPSTATAYYLPRQSSWPAPLKVFLRVAMYISIALLIVTVFLGMMACYFAKQIATGLGEFVVPQVTTTHPVHFPEVHLKHHEIRGIEKRMDQFGHDISHDISPEQDLVLTEDELNGLICDHDNGEMCGYASVTILEDVLQFDFSYPMDDVPGGEGRYFVGTKTFKMKANNEEASSYDLQQSMTVRGPNDEDFLMGNVTAAFDFLEDDLTLEILSAEFFGWVATEAFMDRFLKGRNLAEYMCPEDKAAYVDHIAGVTIGDGKITVHAK